MKELNAKYWNDRYLENDIPWDAGAITTPIKNYIDSLTDKDLHILIPGAGQGHEAIYLMEQGFSNVYVCDWAEKALSYIRVQSPQFPEQQLICTDFFKLDLTFDLILEQTFFCALSPNFRNKYVQKCAAMLRPQGRLVGLLFAENFTYDGPPFGGDKETYVNLFSPHFDLQQLDICPNSIKPRAEREFFINFQKR